MNSTTSDPTILNKPEASMAPPASEAPAAEETFQVMFPSYSHNSFSRLLELEQGGGGGGEQGITSMELDEAIDGTYVLFFFWGFCWTKPVAFLGTQNQSWLTSFLLLSLSLK